MHRGEFDQMILRLQDHFAVRVADWLVAGCLVSWGLAVIGSPAEIWNQPIHSSLAAIASQTCWGALAIALGLVRMGALFINGALRRTPHLRALGAFLTLFIWVQLTLGMFADGMQGNASIFYPWLMIADLYNVYRAMQDAKYSDMRARALRGAAGNAAST